MAKVGADLTLNVRPASLDRPTFAVKGTVSIPAGVDHVNFAVIPWQKFVFKVAGIEQNNSQADNLKKQIPQKELQRRDIPIQPETAARLSSFLLDHTA